MYLLELNDNNSLDLNVLNNKDTHNGGSCEITLVDRTGALKFHK